MNIDDDDDAGDFNSKDAYDVFDTDLIQDCDRMMKIIMIVI